MTSNPLTNEEQASLVEKAFGEENRNRLLGAYFDTAEELTQKNAWRHIYKLLLWVDPTIGLAHCYESDKCQPGRPWYGRSLAFHAWLAQSLGYEPKELGAHIDRLFKAAVSDLTTFAASKRTYYSRIAETQREVYGSDCVPMPGEDPELTQLLLENLAPWLSAAPPESALRTLASELRLYIGQENKRKNLVGEGFEDTLAAVLRRIPEVNNSYDISTRPVLHRIPGFYPPRGDDSALKVDLVLVRRSDGYRTLVTCKWSFRSDREKQFPNEYAAYAALESAKKPFDYVLVTNEFDPARLASVCERTHEVNLLFQSVVHVNPEGPIATYAAPGPDRGKGMRRTREHVQSARLESLEQWLAKLSL